MYSTQIYSKLAKVQGIYTNWHGKSADIPYTLNVWSVFDAPNDGLIEISAYNGTWVSLSNNTTMERRAIRLDNTNQYNPNILAVHAKKGDIISYYIDGKVLNFTNYYES